jgi:serine/threonine-protein kinase
MSFVFAGEHLGSGLPVAVKILLEDHADDDESRARFLREGRIGARVHHQNVVATVTHGSTAEGIVYLVMERLEGRAPPERVLAGGRDRRARDDRTL